MKKCFVIQPFDKGAFDKRYRDSFSPAIKAAGLEPYRVDNDLNTRIPIEDIERGIKESMLCFADITLNNPNVWYELGYAFACGKEVLLVCSEERQGEFPFDIKHRYIITYKTQSSSDFRSLENTITEKIQALLKTTKTTNTLLDSPIIEQEGLKGHEIAILILIGEQQLTMNEALSAYMLKGGMSNAGYNDIATGIGLKALMDKGYVFTSRESDYHSNGEDYLVCRLTDEGEKWLVNNQDKLKMRTEPKPLTDNKLPF